jgi:dephospho-CoA kinase
VVKLVGLTGGIASGKSTVAAMLARLGAAIVNADDLARAVVEPGREAWQEIVDSFGPAVLQEDRAIDRRKLRKLVFGDLAARKRLEAIIHPRVRALAEARIRDLGAAGRQLVVYEVPLLFEGNLHEWLRPVILVACDPATQRARLRNRDALDEAEAERHVAAQMSLSEKRKLADFVIENDGTVEQLEQQVRELYAQLTAT